MRPADDPSVDYGELVRRGYEACGGAYSDARARDPIDDLTPLFERLPARSSVLDLGCGSGAPVARALAERYRVTGIDFSEEQIRRARANVPKGDFVCADLRSASFTALSFDAVVAFYVVFHLPREEHAELFRRIHGWLRPGGYLLATVSWHNEAAYLEDHFFGATMYWSNLGLAEYRQTLETVGFELLASGDFGSRSLAGENHPKILARKPGARLDGEAG